MESDLAEDTDEQLRGRQNDEFKALKECFADQLVDLRKLAKLSKNPKKRKRDKIWIPIELSVKIETRPEPIAQFDLHVKCTRRYPLVPPAIGFKNIKGIGRRLITKLHKQLKHEAASEDHRGQGCIALIIMRAQQFLEDHYRDLELNNKSFYDQMVERKQICDREAEQNRKLQDEMDKLERERQVEEIRQKILKKRELFNESKRRRDSQSSNIENDADDSIYDYDGDLDPDCTTASLTDDTEAANRFDELEEEEDDEQTVIRAPRRTNFSKVPFSKSNDEITESRESSIQSRVGREYEVLEELGHGGFGTVYKVRNRVDSRLYALKKVKLNPDNENLNEKIMREVKLLSRLNHENVIRYYTAWNEVEVSTDTKISSKIGQDSPFLSPRDISRSSDDEADDVYHTSYLINDRNIEKVDAKDTTTNYVVFETSDDRDENEIVESMKKALGSQLSDADSSEEDLNSTTSHKVHRWLYIQMELGQGTLREAIDKGLPRQKDRVRRFFREILDGLCHIHRQGIIHRDLKPVNIFLDSMDRPKIGDFGLATTNLFIVTQNNSPGVSTATAIKPNKMSMEKLRLLTTPEQGDTMQDRSSERLRYIHHNQTDNIGTPLYMSPELSATSEKTRIAKVIYSHKVDVYSLGIIYFEMLYPFSTGHERIIKLQDLRKKSITMPADVDNHLTKEDIELIRLLLTHDVAARPTSEKLLTSNLLPSIGIKEREYQNIIKQVVQNRQARTHKHMLKLLFEQSDSYVDDYVFDFEDVDCNSTSIATPTKFDTQTILRDFGTNIFILDQVKMKMETLLKSRGFLQFSPPMLMPKYSALNHYKKHQLDDVVMLMDKNSSILTLPYDLRLPFARTIARTNISFMSRYVIEKIFRQRQMLGYHPDQFWECCVDIVTPPLSNGASFHPADAEILNLIGDVARLFPQLVNMKPILKINHIQLVKSLISIFSLKEDQVDDILDCISESLNVSMKQQTVNTCNVNLYTNSLPTHVKEDLRKDLLTSKLMPGLSQINNLIHSLDLLDSNPLDLLAQLKQLSSKSQKFETHITTIAQVLRSLDETISYAQGLGLGELTMKFSAGYVLNALRPVSFYSGMVCLLECRRHARSKSKSHPAKTVILGVGGRYDQLIDRFSRNRFFIGDRMHSDTIGERGDKENRPKVAVGVSFEVEKFSRFLLEEFVDRLNNSDQPNIPTIQQLIQLNTNLISFNQLTGSTAINSPCIRYWTMDVAIHFLTSLRSRNQLSLMSNFIRQLRDRGLICNEILPGEFNSSTTNNLMAFCIENRIPYLMTLKSQSIDVSPGDESPSSSILSTSPSVSPTSKPLGQQACLSTLYQLDKNHLREVKRCDTQSMLDFISKKMNL